MSSDNSFEVRQVGGTQSGILGVGFEPPAGYEPLGWSTYRFATEADPAYAPGNTVTITNNLHLYAIWREKKVECKITNHFIKTDGTDVTSSDTVQYPLGKALNEYKPDKTTIEYNEETYLFDRTEASGTATETGPNNFDVYYDIDMLGNGGSDGIADKFQRLVTYQVENGAWADGMTGKKTEVVTLMDGEEYSETGTGKLTAPEAGEPAEGYTTGIWSTTTGSAPDTVTKDGPFVYTYSFIDEDTAVIIQPTEVREIYNGKEQTFKEFTAKKVNGETWPGITVTLKGDANLEGCGWTDATDESGVSVDLSKILADRGESWQSILDVQGITDEQKKKVLLVSGTIIIDPCPVEVKLNVTELNELQAGIGNGKEGDEPVTPTYKYDKADKELIAEFIFDGYEHTISLAPNKFEIKDKNGTPVDVKLAPDEGSTAIVLRATRVGDTEKMTLDLTSAALELADAGADADNYTVSGSKATTISRAPIMNGSEEEEVITDLTGKEVEKISVRIVPRPVKYWTYGGAKIFDGSGIPSADKKIYNTAYMNAKKVDPDDKPTGEFIAQPKYDEIVKEDGSAIGEDEPGFIVRLTDPFIPPYTTLNLRPKDVDIESPIDAGITDCSVGIITFMDDIDHTNDYAIDFELGYFTIYPQSITNDPSFYDDGFKTIDTFTDDYEAAVIEYKYTDRGKTDIPTDKQLTAFYTGVQFTGGPAETYTYDGNPHKFEGGTLRNDKNAEGYKELKEGTDYTVAYYRQDDKGKWNEISADTDFIEPGKIKVVYQGINNYRNRIEKTYEIVRTPGEVTPPTVNPGEVTPPPPGDTLDPDVETDDREHYGYIIGKPDGSVDPDGEITRAEIATIIFRLLKEEVREEFWSKTNTFPDVESADWYNNAISTLENLGIVEGKDDGLFHPDDPITRAEMAAMMARLYDYDMNTGDFHTKFDDIDPTAWYARYVAAAEKLELFIGDGATNHVYPNRSLTRAEAMTVYNRLLGRKPHRDGLLPEKQMILWPDNTDTAAWYYADVQEAANSHTCAMDDLTVNGKVYERWLAPLPMRDWAALERTWSDAHSGDDGHDVN